MKKIKGNIITDWLEKHGDPEIEAQVEREVRLIMRKSRPVYVCQMFVGDLDKEKCSSKFLQHNLPDDHIVNVKCHETGELDLRGKGEYRILLEDNDLK